MAAHPSREQRTRCDAEAVTDIAEALHRIIGSTIARGDWTRTVAVLELLGDMHSRARTGFARMTYARAARIADKQRLANAGRLRDKWKREEGRM